MHISHFKFSQQPCKKSLHKFKSPFTPFNLTSLCFNAPHCPVLIQLNFSRVLEPLPNTPDNRLTAGNPPSYSSSLNSRGKPKLLLNTARTLPFITRTGSFSKVLVDYIVWLLFSRWEGL